MIDELGLRSVSLRRKPQEGNRMTQVFLFTTDTGFSEVSEVAGPKRSAGAAAAQAAEERRANRNGRRKISNRHIAGLSLMSVGH
ncbi:hypothetical protein GW17_00006445 [Ensete ventricosum]|nr:hypothetical protein GW17_00006445 [Ensete ventricosum]